MCELHYRNSKKTRQAVTHQELLGLHRASEDAAVLSRQQRDPHRSRLIEKFRMAIKEAKTAGELQALSQLMDTTDPEFPKSVCPDVLKTYLANRLKHFTAVEAKTAKAIARATAVTLSTQSA